MKKNSHLRSWIVTIIIAFMPHISMGKAEVEKYDVVVYGGTPGGITSAIAAAREGASVILLEQTKHVGGLSTSGLNRDELEHMDHLTIQLSSVGIQIDRVLFAHCILYVIRKLGGGI